MVIYLDGASLQVMEKYAPKVAGFTTNPSLLKASGVSNYRAFAREALAIAGGKPISFEVLADDEPTILAQAKEISSWGPNVYVKVPIVNSEGKVQANILHDLSFTGVKLNVTAIFTAEQVSDAAAALNGMDHILSIFAGRIYDAGVDPRPTIRHAFNKHRQVLWASARQVFDVVLAEHSGCSIITLSSALIDKLPLRGKDLTQYSIETAKQFYNDGRGIEF